MGVTAVWAEADITRAARLPKMGFLIVLFDG
jgi:hypothetical protein